MNIRGPSVLPMSQSDPQICTSYAFTQQPFLFRSNAIHIVLPAYKGKETDPAIQVQSEERPCPELVARLMRCLCCLA